MKSLRCMLGIHDLYVVNSDYIYFHKAEHMKVVTDYVCLRCGKRYNNIEYHTKKENKIRERLMELKLARSAKAKELLGDEFKEEE